jgi:hypothetical protein
MILLWANFLIKNILPIFQGPREHTQHSNSLQDRWFGAWTPAETWEFLFSAPGQTSLGAHPTSYTMGTGVLSQGEVSHPHQAVWLRMSRAIPLLTLCVYVSCYRKTSTFSLFSYKLSWKSTNCWWWTWCTKLQAPLLWPEHGHLHFMMISLQNKSTVPMTRNITGF